MAEAMTKAREGEIALALLREVFRREGIRLRPDRMRELRSVFEDIKKRNPELNLTFDELKGFAHLRAQELMEECFSDTGTKKHGDADIGFHRKHGH